MAGEAIDPNIVQRYRLFYYLGHFVTRCPHPIYSAIGEDGIHFEVE